MQESLDIQENSLKIFKFFLRNSWRILTFLIVILTSVFFITIKQKKFYKSTATIRIEEKSAKVINVQEVSSTESNTQQARNSFYETQYRLIKSREYFIKMIQELDFYKEKNPEKIVNKIGKIVKINPIRNTELVEISVEHRSPEKAALIANAVANQAIKQNAKRTQKIVNFASEWIENKIQNQKERLINSEKNIQKFSRENRIDVLPITGDIASEQIKSEYVKQLALYDNISTRYTTRHPKMIELKSQIDSLRNKIHGFEKNEDLVLQYRVLEREMDTNKKMYQILLQRLKEVNLSSDLPINNFSLVEEAVISKVHVKPNLKINLILAAIIGLFSGIFICFFIDNDDKILKNSFDLKKSFGYELTANIPSLKGKLNFKKFKNNSLISHLKRKEQKIYLKNLFVHLMPTSAFAEACKHIRTDIYRNQEKGSFIFTSCEPKAGKTIITTNISIAVAQSEKKVLLMDCDLRKPQLHKIFNLKKEMGIANYLHDKNILPNEIIQKTTINNLDVTTAGNYFENPSELLCSPRMKLFLSFAEKKYDYVFIDTPPAISVTDPIILASYVDGIFFIARAGKTLKNYVVNTKRKIDNISKKFVGTILNDVNYKEQDYYYYYYPNTK
jgi:polysaccharide biosynthesis transport protein